METIHLDDLTKVDEPAGASREAGFIAAAEPSATPLDAAELQALLGSAPPAASRRGGGWLAAVLLFIAGLLLGWLLIGWWLWPVEWTNVAPWNMALPYQKRFVELVAVEYEQTGDAVRAQDALSGWALPALEQLLSALENEATTAQERRRLAALRQALSLPDPDTTPSLLSSLLGQKAIVWSALAGGVILLAAVLLVAAPRILRARILRALSGKREDEELPPELLASLGQAQPSLSDILNISEAEIDLAVQQTEQVQGGEEKQDVDSMMRMFINMDGLVSESDVDLSNLDETQSLLSSLFEVSQEEDIRFQTLSRDLDEIDVHELGRDVQAVIEQLGQINALPSDRPEDEAWPG